MSEQDARMTPPPGGACCGGRSPAAVATGREAPGDHRADPALESVPREALFIGDHVDADVVRTHLAGRRDFCVHSVPCGDPALATLAERRFDVVFLCACKPGTPGLRVLAEGRHLQAHAPFIVFTGDASPETAVTAMQLGAFDYLLWPVEPALLDQHLERALRYLHLSQTVAQIADERGMLGCCGMVGTSERMRRVYDLVQQVAPTNSTVLIAGETGTGKELVARAVHDRSRRRTKAFVPINCAAVPESLIESELFGHIRGSFTGAVASRRGLLAAAPGGTVFLDDIETLPLPMQGKLLRAIEERCVQPVGGREVPVDFRLVAATNVDLATMVAAGDFREDLYYRLSVFPIELPPLRERRDDVPALAAHFAGLVAKDLEMEPPFLDEALLEQLMAHDWPGNVRELRNWIERAVILARGTGVVSLPAPQATNGSGAPTLSEHARLGWSLERLTEEYIRAVLEHTGGHRTRAAEILGIDRRTIYRKVPTRRKILPMPRTGSAM